MEASAINAPHPDESDEADLFFGDPEPERPDEQDSPPQALAQPTAPPPEPQDAKRGSVEREYVVFQKVTLTDAVLKRLLHAIEQGDIADPHVAYVELHRAVARNDKEAVAKAYLSNRDQLGERCTLAAVTNRSFHERNVAPQEPKTQTRLAIS